MSVDTSTEPHVCEDTDVDYVVCIDGIVYGYCESENCTGGCESQGSCYCECHNDEEEASNGPRHQA